MKLRIEVDLKDGNTCRGCAFDYVADIMKALKNSDPNLKKDEHFPFGFPVQLLSQDEFVIMESLPPINQNELTKEEVAALPVVGRVSLLRDDFNTERQQTRDDVLMNAIHRDSGDVVPTDSVVAQSKRSN